MSQEHSHSLAEVVRALRELMHIFHWERMLYLAFGLVSLAIFVAAGYRMLTEGSVSQELMLAMLGSTGVAAACSARVVFFLSKAFGLVEMLVIPGRNTKGE